MCVRSEIKARRVTEHEDDMSTRAWLRAEEGSNSSGLTWIRVATKKDKWSVRYPAGGSVVEFGERLVLGRAGKCAFGMW